MHVSMPRCFLNGAGCEDQLERDADGAVVRGSLPMENDYDLHVKRAPEVEPAWEDACVETEGGPLCHRVTCAVDGLATTWVGFRLTSGSVSTCSLFCSLRLPLNYNPARGCHLDGRHFTGSIKGRPSVQSSWLVAQWGSADDLGFPGGLSSEMFTPVAGPPDEVRDVQLTADDVAVVADRNKGSCLPPAADYVVIHLDREYATSRVKLTMAHDVEVLVYAWNDNQEVGAATAGAECAIVEAEDGVEYDIQCVSGAHAANMIIIQKADVGEPDFSLCELDVYGRIPTNWRLPVQSHSALSDRTALGNPAVDTCVEYTPEEGLVFVSVRLTNAEDPESYEMDRVKVVFDSVTDVDFVEFWVLSASADGYSEQGAANMCAKRTDPEEEMDIRCAAVGSQMELVIQTGSPVSVCDVQVTGKFARQKAEDVGLSWDGMLRFQGITLQTHGMFRLCFCDSAQLPAGQRCSETSHYNFEVGRVHSTGVSCLLGDARFRRGTCVPQRYGGLRCYSSASEVPRVEAPFPDTTMERLRLSEAEKQAERLAQYCLYGPAVETRVAVKYADICTAKLDVVLILDSSTSVGEDLWDQQVAAVRALLEIMELGNEDRVALGLVKMMADEATTMAALTDDLAHLKYRLAEDPYNPGASARGNFAAAFTRASQLLDHGRLDTDSVCVLFADDGISGSGGDVTAAQAAATNLPCRLVTLGLPPAGGFDGTAWVDQAADAIVASSPVEAMPRLVERVCGASVEHKTIVYDQMEVSEKCKAYAIGLKEQKEEAGWEEHLGQDYAMYTR